MLDEDKSGILLMAEVKIALKSKKDTLKMIREIDVEDDDDIELDEWKTYWQSSDSGSESQAEMKLKQLKGTLLRIQHEKTPRAGKKVQRRRMRQHNNSAIERLAIQVFNMLDEDKRGTLLMAEVKIALKSKKDTLKMIHEIDVEDDDDIELDEWSNYWQSSDSGSESQAEMKLKQLKGTLLRIQHGVA